MTFNEIKNKIAINYEVGAITDDQLIDLIENLVDYLNLKTVTGTAKERGKSYRGINNFNSPDLIIDNVKFFKNNF